MGGGLDSHLRRGRGRRSMPEVRAEAERTAPPGWWGRAGGGHGPWGHEAEDGWRWPRSLVPGAGRVARPCVLSDDFRRTAASSILKWVVGHRSHRGGQPGGRAEACDPGPSSRKGVWGRGCTVPGGPCREGRGAAGPGRIVLPAPQKRGTGTGFPAWCGAHETQISIVLSLSESVRGSHGGGAGGTGVSCSRPARGLLPAQPHRGTFVPTCEPTSAGAEGHSRVGRRGALGKRVVITRRVFSAHACPPVPPAPPTVSCSPAIRAPSVVTCAPGRRSPPVLPRPPPFGGTGWRAGWGGPGSGGRLRWPRLAENRVAPASRMLTFPSCQKGGPCSHIHGENQVQVPEGRPTAYGPTPAELQGLGQGLAHTEPLAGPQRPLRLPHLVLASGELLASGFCCPERRWPGSAAFLRPGDAWPRDLGSPVEPGRAADSSVFLCTCEDGLPHPAASVPDQKAEVQIFTFKSLFSRSGHFSRTQCKDALCDLCGHRATCSTFSGSLTAGVPGPRCLGAHPLSPAPRRRVELVLCTCQAPHCSGLPARNQQTVAGCQLVLLWGPGGRLPWVGAGLLEARCHPDRRIPETLGCSSAPGPREHETPCKSLGAATRSAPACGSQAGRLPSSY